MEYSTDILRSFVKKVTQVKIGSKNLPDYPDTERQLGTYSYRAFKDFTLQKNNITFDYLILIYPARESLKRDQCFSIGLLLSVENATRYRGWTDYLFVSSKIPDTQSSIDIGTIDTSDLSIIRMPDPQQVPPENAHTVANHILYGTLFLEHREPIATLPTDILNRKREEHKAKLAYRKVMADYRMQHIPKSIQKALSNFSPAYQAVYLKIAECPAQSKDIASSVGISAAAVTNIVMELIAAGLVVREGSKKTGVYRALTPKEYWSVNYPTTKDG